MNGIFQEKTKLTTQLEGGTSI